MITVDALSKRMLWGNHGNWETAPELWKFFDESVVLRNVLTPRGLTAVALTSLSTGVYPRDHGLRVNGNLARPSRDTLFERFQAAGYYNLGYSANLCYVMDYGVDERVCTWRTEEPDLGGLEERDELLVSQLIERLDSLSTDQPVFIWLHLNQPHKPFRPVVEFYKEFHPQPYTGDLDLEDVMAVDRVALGVQDLSGKERRHMEATYASQVRAVDGRIARLLDKLDEVGRYQDSLIVFGADHSEELAEHNNFFYHGCPPYNDTLGISFAFHAPAHLPQGLVIDDWVSNTDIAPTIAEVSGAFRWSGDPVGRSLASSLQSGIVEPRPIYLERGVETAGIIDGLDKYIMSGTEGTNDCTPYNKYDAVYPGELEELYDLESDPGELNNIFDERTSLRDDLRTQLCEWIQQDDWVPWEDVDNNALLTQCAKWLAD